MKLSKNKTVFFYFIFIGIIGTCALPDYGVHLDETNQIIRGGVNAKYILNKFVKDVDQKYPAVRKVPDLQSYKEKDHGAFFEIFTVGLAKILSINVTRHEAERELFYLRHIILFIIFFLSLVIAYKLMELRLNKWKFSLLLPSFIILSPRIFANSFYNSKDILFLALCVFALYYLFVYLRKRTFVNLVIASLFGGLAASTRIIGFIFPMLLGISMIFDYLLSKDLLNKIRSKFFLYDLLYFPLFIIFLVLFFPTLWENPLKNLLMIFDNMSHYDKLSFYNLYFNRYINAKQIPWHYLPVWIGITTPIIVLLFFFPGITSFIYNIFSKKYHSLNKMDVLIFIFVLFPFSYVILSNSVLYNGWRHMYFLYIGIAYFSVLGLYKLYSKLHFNTLKIKRIIFISIILFSFSQPIYFMIKNHPYQNVYFNSLIPKSNLESSFELDYWGLSYKQALEFILNSDNSNTIMVYVRLSLENNKNPNYYILKNSDKKRIHFVAKDKEASYLITEKKLENNNILRKWNHYHTITAGNVNILNIYKSK